ncbi:MAG: hypothetical protein JOZ62_09605 [Acidobacteriaceae bacterium]|nr:hypothetical protein [Acidobacteriaceae bacterium]
MSDRSPDRWLKGLHHLAFFCLALLLPWALQAQANPPQPGELPNTVSAPSLTEGDKFAYRVVQSLGLRGFAGAAIGASIGQARNSPSEWGQGVAGFSKRYGSGFAGNFSRQAFAFTLESVFHEDPRYFPSEEKTIKERTLNAAKQVFWTKTDDGSSEVAYGRLISEFGAAEFTNVWQAHSTGKQSSAIIRTCVGLGGDAAYNFMQEFIPFTRPRSLRHQH